jgi:hypothetical protein
MIYEDKELRPLINQDEEATPETEAAPEEEATPEEGEASE